ncbi:stalk domain-containing protein [Paenibacillus sp. MMO-58]|uniref:stalk domain-containing protein n=1 Tax=Paenibacillus sp. MMO-58 TaxID=3081290 RepID=UPI003015A7EE
MKKLITMFLVFSLLFVGMNTKNVEAKTTAPMVYLDGQKMNFAVEPIVQAGITLVQFRPIFEKLGFKVSYDSKTKVITGTSENISIKMTVGSFAATVNDKNATLEVKPKTINGNLMVPLRFVGQSAGYDVTYKNGVINLNKSTKLGIQVIDGVTYNIVHYSMGGIRVGVSAKMEQDKSIQDVYRVIIFNDRTDTYTNKVSWKAKKIGSSIEEEEALDIAFEQELYQYNKEIQPNSSYKAVVSFSTRSGEEWDALSYGGVIIPLPTTQE